MSARGLRRFIGDLIGERRPRPFRAKPDDAAEVRVAIMLRAAQPGGGTPREEFVEQLHQRLAADRGEGMDGGSGGLLVPNAGVWSTVATTRDLPEGGVRAFDVGTVVGFVRRAGGQVRGISGICTHQGCRLALDAAMARLNCPCHRTVFAVTGEVVRSQLRTPPRTLPGVRVREIDGVIQVYAPPKSV